MFRLHGDEKKYHDISLTSLLRSSDDIFFGLWLNMGFENKPNNYSHHEKIIYSANSHILSFKWHSNPIRKKEEKGFKGT